MSEPMYMQGDSIARSLSELSTAEVSCRECDREHTIEVEEQYSKLDQAINWWGTLKCEGCGAEYNVEGWYNV